MKLIMAQRYTDVGSGGDATCGAGVQIECLGGTRSRTNWLIDITLGCGRTFRTHVWSLCHANTTQQSTRHYKAEVTGSWWWVSEAQIGGCLSMYSGEVNTVWLKRAGAWDCTLEVSQLLHICSKVVYCRTQLLNLLISPLPTGLFLSLCLPLKVSTG